MTEVKQKHTAIEKICLVSNESSPIDDCIQEALITGVRYKIDVELNYNGERKYFINTTSILRDIFKSGEYDMEDI